MRLDYLYLVSVSLLLLLIQPSSINLPSNLISNLGMNPYSESYKTLCKKPVNDQMEKDLRRSVSDEEKVGSEFRPVSESNQAQAVREETTSSYQVFSIWNWFHLTCILHNTWVLCILCMRMFDSVRWIWPIIKLVYNEVSKKRKRKKHYGARLR